MNSESNMSIHSDMSEHSDSELFQDPTAENEQSSENVETSENQGIAPTVETGTNGRVGEGLSAENVAASGVTESDLGADPNRLEAGGRRGSSSSTASRPLTREVNWLRQNKANFDSLFDRSQPSQPSLARSRSQSDLTPGGVAGSSSDEQNTDQNEQLKQIDELKRQLAQALTADREKNDLLAHAEAERQEKERLLNKKSEDYNKLVDFQENIKRDMHEQERTIHSKMRQLREAKDREDQQKAGITQRDQALKQLTKEHTAQVSMFQQVSKNAIDREKDIEVMQGQIETQKRDLMRLRNSDENYNKAMEDMVTEVQTYQNELERIRLEDEAKEQETQKLKEKLQRREERLRQQELQKTELTRKRQLDGERLQEMQTLVLETKNEAARMQREIDILRRDIEEHPDGDFDRNAMLAAVATREREIKDRYEHQLTERDHLVQELEQEYRNTIEEERNRYQQLLNRDKRRHDENEQNLRDRIAQLTEKTEQSDGVLAEVYEKFDRLEQNIGDLQAERDRLLVNHTSDQGVDANTHTELLNKLSNVELERNNLLARMSNVARENVTLHNDLANLRDSSLAHENIPPPTPLQEEEEEDDEYDCMTNSETGRKALDDLKEKMNKDFADIERKQLEDAIEESLRTFTHSRVPDAPRDALPRMGMTEPSGPYTRSGDNDRKAMEKGEFKVQPLLTQEEHHRLVSAERMMPQMDVYQSEMRRTMENQHKMLKEQSKVIYELRKNLHTQQTQPIMEETVPKSYEPDSVPVRRPPPTNYPPEPYSQFNPPTVAQRGVPLPTRTMDEWERMENRQRMLEKMVIEIKSSQQVLSEKRPLSSEENLRRREQELQKFSRIQDPRHEAGLSQASNPQYTGNVPTELTPNQYGYNQVMTDTLRSLTEQVARLKETDAQAPAWLKHSNAIQPYKATDDIEQWLDRFDLVTGYLNIVDDTSKVAYLQTKLSSSHCTVLQSQPPYVLADFDEVKRLLIQRFGDTRTPIERVDELSNITQTGTVQEYITNIEKIIVRCCPGAGVGPVDPLLLETFRRGLKSNIRTYMKIMPKSSKPTLQEVFTYAIRAEQITQDADIKAMLGGGDRKDDRSTTRPTTRTSRSPAPPTARRPTTTDDRPVRKEYTPGGVKKPDEYIRGMAPWLDYLTEHKPEKDHAESNDAFERELEKWKGLQEEKGLRAKSKSPERRHVRTAAQADQTNAQVVNQEEENLDKVIRREELSDNIKVYYDILAQDGSSVTWRILQDFINRAAAQVLADRQRHGSPHNASTQSTFQVAKRPPQVTFNQQQKVIHLHEGVDRYVSLARLNYIECKIGKATWTVFIDCGASMNIVGPDLFQHMCHLKGNKGVVRPLLEPLEVRGWSNDVQQLTEVIELEVEYHGWKHKIIAYIDLNSEHALTLGQAALTTFPLALVDLTTKRILTPKLPQDEEKCEFLELPQTTTIEVTATSEINQRLITQDIHLGNQMAADEWINTGYAKEVKTEESPLYESSEEQENEFPLFWEEPLTKQRFPINQETGLPYDVFDPKTQQSFAPASPLGKTIIRISHKAKLLTDAWTENDKPTVKSKKNKTKFAVPKPPMDPENKQTLYAHFKLRKAVHIGPEMSNSVQIYYKENLKTGQQFLLNSNSRLATEDSKKFIWAKRWKVNPNLFKENDRVMVFHPDKRKTKLSALLAGPYLVVRVRNTVAYIVPTSRPNDKPRTINFDRLSLCYPELPDTTFENKRGELIASLARSPTLPRKGEGLAQMEITTIVEPCELDSKQIDARALTKQVSASKLLRDQMMTEIGDVIDKTLACDMSKLQIGLAPDGPSTSTETKEMPNENAKFVQINAKAMQNIAQDMLDEPETSPIVTGLPPRPPERALPLESPMRAESSQSHRTVIPSPAVSTIQPITEDWKEPFLYPFGRCRNEYTPTPFLQPDAYQTIKQYEPQAPTSFTPWGGRRFQQQAFYDVRAAPRDFGAPFSPDINHKDFPFSLLVPYSDKQSPWITIQAMSYVRAPESSHFGVRNAYRENMCPSSLCSPVDWDDITGGERLFLNPVFPLLGTHDSYFPTIFQVERALQLPMLLWEIDYKFPGYNAFEKCNLVYLQQDPSTQLMCEACAGSTVSMGYNNVPFGSGSGYESTYSKARSVMTRIFMILDVARRAAHNDRNSPHRLANAAPLTEEEKVFYDAEIIRPIHSQDYRIQMYRWELPDIFQMHGFDWRFPFDRMIKGLREWRDTRGVIQPAISSNPREYAKRVENDQNQYEQFRRTSFIRLADFFKWHVQLRRALAFQFHTNPNAYAELTTHEFRMDSFGSFPDIVQHEHEIFDKLDERGCLLAQAKANAENLAAGRPLIQPLGPFGTQAARRAAGTAL